MKTGDRVQCWNSKLHPEWGVYLKRVIDNEEKHFVYVDGERKIFKNVRKVDNKNVMDNK